jgi:DNA repair protein RadC
MQLTHDDIKSLSRASLVELGQFLPRRKAEAVIAALTMSSIAESEQALSARLDNPESIYRACTDMKLFNQEVLRVILLDTRFSHVSTVEISRGTINESLAHPREILRPAIIHSAFAFFLVHNHPSGDASPSEADFRSTRRISEATRLMQIQMLDHVIIGSPVNGQPGYFSFKEAGLLL